MKLSEKQKYVIVGLASEKTIKEIACELGLTGKAIEWHWAKIKQKTGIKSHAGAAHFAIANGWIDLLYDN